MAGFSVDIERETLENGDFRRVLYTAPHSQFVVMTLQPGEEIGEETHTEHDQFIRIEAGQGEAILGGDRHSLRTGTAVVIPAGTRHNVVNVSPTEPLQLYTLYSPPAHPDGTVNHTRLDAEAYERERHG